MENNESFRGFLQHLVNSRRFAARTLRPAPLLGR